MRRNGKAISERERKRSLRVAEGNRDTAKNKNVGSKICSTMFRHGSRW